MIPHPPITTTTIRCHFSFADDTTSSSPNRCHSQRPTSSRCQPANIAKPKKIMNRILPIYVALSNNCPGPKLWLSGSNLPLITKIACHFEFSSGSNSRYRFFGVFGNYEMQAAAKQVLVVAS